MPRIPKYVIIPNSDIVLKLRMLGEIMGKRHVLLPSNLVAACINEDKAGRTGWTNVCAAKVVYFLADMLEESHRD